MSKANTIFSPQSFGQPIAAKSSPWQMQIWAGQGDGSSPAFQPDNPPTNDVGLVDPILYAQNLSQGGGLVPPAQNAAGNLISAGVLPATSMSPEYLRQTSANITQIAMNNSNQRPINKKALNQNHWILPVILVAGIVAYFVAKR